jgi:predicted ArsR family transcriptional regulator
LPRNIKEKILTILKENPKGLTTIKIANLVGVHRNTIPRYLYELKGEERVQIREIGSAKLFYLNEKFVKKVRDRGVIRKLRGLMS